MCDWSNNGCMRFVDNDVVMVICVVGFWYKVVDCGVCGCLVGLVSCRGDSG